MRCLAIVCAWCVCALAAGAADDWSTLVNQAGAKVSAGDFAEGLKLYREALAIAESFGPTDPRLAANLDYLGNTYSLLGQWPESERCFRRALPMMDGAAWEGSAGRGLFLLDMGTMYGNSGRFDRAEGPLREALAILERQLPANDTRTALARTANGTVKMMRKEYRDAEDLLRQGIAALEKSTARNCLPLGSAYDSLGSVMGRERRGAEEVAFHEIAVKTLEGCGGADYPLLVDPLNNLAMSYLREAENGKAEAAFLRAISICERGLGTDHPAYGKLLGNYADFLRHTNRKAEAKKVAARAQSAMRDSARRMGAGWTVDVSSFRK